MTFCLGQLGVDNTIYILFLPIHKLTTFSTLFYVPSFSPPLLPSPQTVINVCELLPKTRIPDLLITIISLVGFVAVKELNDHFKKKLPLPIPIELIGVSPLYLLFCATCVAIFD